MADSDVVESLRGYFMETETTHPCDALRKADYETFHSLIDRALADDPENARLWFWKGWGHQFFQKESTFEWAEDAYERALQCNPEFAPAVLALSYLYWKTGFQRAKQDVIEEIKRQYKVSLDNALEFFELLETTDLGDALARVDEMARATVSQEVGGATWRMLDAHLLVEGLNLEHEHSGNLLVWYQLFVEMSEDLGLSPIELSLYHSDFAYGFFNYAGLTEFAPEVREAFVAVKRYSGPSRQLADALAYLALSNSERNQESPNPRTAYTLLQQLLDLYELHQADPAVIRTSAYDSYDEFLRDFYAWNPVFCQNNPGQCVALFERSQHLGLIPTKWSSEVRPWAGHFYFQVGRYKDSVAQFELVLDQIKKKVEFHRDFALALVRTKRVDAAIRFLEEANHAQRSDDAETLLMLLREIQSKDENNEWLVRSFGRELQDTPRPPTMTEVLDRCRADWPAYWDAFPEALQRMIATAEYAQQVIGDADAWDYSMLGAQWGKIAEIALEYGFLRPFSKFVDQNGVTSVKALPGGKRRDANAQWLRGPDLSLDGLKRTKQIVRIGLLWAASDDVNHPVAEMVNALGLDSDLWRNRIPGQLDAIRRVRNLFVHPDQIAEADDVARLRAILMTEGLLANLGQAMLYAQNARW